MPSNSNLKYYQRLKNLFLKEPQYLILPTDGLSSNRLEDVLLNLGEVEKIHLKRKVFNSFNRKKQLPEIPEMGPGVIVFPQGDVFQAREILNQLEINKPLKVGEIMSQDLLIPQGETTLSAGPMLKKINALGAKAKLVKGKISLMQDFLLVKSGDKVNQEQKEVCDEMGLKPLKEKTNPKLIFQNSKLFLEQELQEFIIDKKTILTASTLASNLVQFQGYPSEEYVLGQIYQVSLESIVVLQRICLDPQSEELK